MSSFSSVPSSSIRSLLANDLPGRAVSGQRVLANDLPDDPISGRCVCPADDAPNASTDEELRIL